MCQSKQLISCVLRRATAFAVPQTVCRRCGGGGVVDVVPLEAGVVLELWLVLRRIRLCAFVSGGKPLLLPGPLSRPDRL